MRILSLLLLLFLIISCNSKSENSKSNQKTEIEKQQEVVPSISKEKVNQNKEDNAPIQFNSETDDLILFKEIKQLKPMDDKTKIFKGISSNLMSYIIIDYITKNHFDPDRYNDVVQNSIVLDFSDQSFTYSSLSVSDITEYDVQIHEINNRHRLSFGDYEEMTEEEIKEWDKEHQKMLEDVDSALVNIEKYDRFIINGTWNYEGLHNDSLFLNLDISIKNTDPIEFERYGENFLYVDDEIKDELKIDLFESIYSLGQNKKFNETDLKIFDSEDLTYIRNQFYARKGYIFKTEKMKSFFEAKSWYKGVSEDVTEQFNQTELENIYFIKDKESNKK